MIGKWISVAWWCNNGDREKPKLEEKACPSAILSTSSPTHTTLESKPGLGGDKLATNRLSNRTTLQWFWAGESTSVQSLQLYCYVERHFREQQTIGNTTSHMQCASFLHCSPCAPSTGARFILNTAFPCSEFMLFHNSRIRSLRTINNAQHNCFMCILHHPFGYHKHDYTILSWGIPVVCVT